MGPIVRSTLDIALWFVDRADSAGRQISPRKLHGLLFMAQVRFASDNGGRKLMPATFLAAETGPIEPTIYHIFEAGRPRVKAATPGFSVEELLMETWDRFGELPDAEFSRLNCETQAVPAIAPRRAQQRNRVRPTRRDRAGAGAAAGARASSRGKSQYPGSRHQVDAGCLRHQAIRSRDLSTATALAPEFRRAWSARADEGRVATMLFLHLFCEGTFLSFSNCSENFSQGSPLSTAGVNHT